MNKIEKIIKGTLAIGIILLVFCVVMAQIEQNEYRNGRVEDAAILAAYKLENIPHKKIYMFVYDDETIKRFAALDPNAPEEQKE